VYAIVFGVVALGALAALLVVGILVFTWSQGPRTTASSAAPAAPSPAAAAVVEEPAVVEIPPPTRTPTRSSGPRTQAVPPPATAPPPAAPAPTGTMSVTFTGTPLPTDAVVTCGEQSFKSSVSESGGASFSAVPTSGDCKLKPRGVNSYSPYVGVKGGRSYRCSVTGGNTVCN
jgi:hypothetical protein